MVMPPIIMMHGPYGAQVHRPCASVPARPLRRVPRPALLLALLALLGCSRPAAAQTDPCAMAAVVLGDAAGYVVLAGLSVTNVGPSLITGDLGVSSAFSGGTTSLSGFPPGLMGASSTIHHDDWWSDYGAEPAL
jgi:hypothetical protein